MKKTNKERIIELKQLIQKYDKLYYEDGVSEISDAEYDRLYDEYAKLEEEFPEFKEMSNSPTKRVGAGDESGSTTLLPKFTHKSPLLSINRKSKSLEDLKAFYESIGGDGTEVIIEPKLDGITCNINYENGKFINAATRGNGYIGDLITENFKNTDTIYPQTIPNRAALEIRGEAIIPYNFFKENLLKDYSNPRNAVAGIMRSINADAVEDKTSSEVSDAVSDAVEDKTSSEVKGKGVQVMFYDIGKTSLDLQENDFSNLFYISNLKFQTIPVMNASTWSELKSIVESKLNNSIKEVDGFNVLMTHGKFPQAVCDGLVIKVNDINLRNKLGMTEKGPRWAFAYKFKPLEATTRIDHIEWQVGKSGRITPVAIFNEITLGGTKITKATLNNYDYMKNLSLLYNRRDIWLQECYDNWGERVDVSYNKPIERIEYILPGDIIRDTKTNQFIHVEFVDKNLTTHTEIFRDEEGGTYYFEEDRYFLFNENNGLQIDDTIIVERSNDVIPRIIGIHHRNNLLYPQDMETTERFGKRKNSFNLPQTCPICGHPTNKDGPLTFCTNPLCSAQLKGRLEHFSSRNAMNIIGLGEAIIDIFVDKGYLKEFADIYKLERYKEEIIKLDKFGEKKFKNLQTSIQKSKQPTLAAFIYSLGIPLVGNRMSKELAKRYETLSHFLDLSYEDLMKIGDVSGITSLGIIKTISDEKFKESIRRLLEQDVTPQETKNNNVEQIFYGKTFVITGTLPHPRQYYVDKIEGRGGKVAGSVSKKTYAVLIGSDAGSKEVKARSLLADGNPILILDNEIDIENIIN